MFSIVDAEIYIPTNNVGEGSLFSKCSPPFIICRLFDNCLYDICEIIFHCGVDLCFSNN